MSIGKVLDFGSGSGEYLKYAYRARNSSSSSKPVTELVALEPNLNLHATLTRSIAALEREQEQELGQAKVLSTKIVGCFADEHLKEVGEGYYDWIILGNVRMFRRPPVGGRARHTPPAKSQWHICITKTIARQCTHRIVHVHVCMCPGSVRGCGTILM